MLDVVRKYVKDANVLILGYGREGKSSLKTIIEAGGYKSITVADMNQVTIKAKDVTGISDDVKCDTVDALSQEVGCEELGRKQLDLSLIEKEISSINYLCGGEYQKSINDYDVIFKSPGIVFEMPFEQITAKVVSQCEIFFERYRNQIIGVTGTKGKSTTTTLIYHVLKEAKKDVVLAGNIGIPAFDIYKQINDETIICFEMSSHMLEYMTVAPKTAIYLNVHEEHLDHYKTMEKYVAAKENIYKNQVEGDTLYVNEMIAPKKGECRANVITVGYGKKGNGIITKEMEMTPVSLREKDVDIRLFGNQITYKNHAYVIQTNKINLLGEHNYFNIAVAYGVCSNIGVNDDIFEKALSTFKTLPHRLEFVGSVNGVKYYDDSISTICDTAIQALISLKDVSTILIGGMDRGIEYDELITFLSKHHVSNIILMEATGKRIMDEIEEKYPDFVGKNRIHLVEHLEDAVLLAKKLTPAGRSCVMSPAAASYGIFKNFEERGERFKNLVLDKQN